MIFFTSFVHSDPRNFTRYDIAAKEVNEVDPYQNGPDQKVYLELSRYAVL